MPPIQTIEAVGAGDHERKRMPAQPGRNGYVARIKQAKTQPARRAQESNRARPVCRHQTPHPFPCLPIPPIQGSSRARQRIKDYLPSHRLRKMAVRCGRGRRAASRDAQKIRLANSNLAVLRIRGPLTRPMPCREGGAEGSGEEHARSPRAAKGAGQWLPFARLRILQSI
jgi:hypothetical protein